LLTPIHYGKRLKIVTQRRSKMLDENKITNEIDELKEQVEDLKQRVIILENELSRVENNMEY